MIQLRHVSYRYLPTSPFVLDDVSVTIAAGSFTLIVGASGSGKSTLVRCINGLVPHFSGGILMGEIRVAGRDPVLVGPSGMSSIVGCVFQDPEGQAVMDQVEDEVAFALEHAGMDRQTMRVRVEETLDLLDLTPLRNRNLASLSGGERQRTAIAAALALRPQILVLDEPTSQLDPQSAEDVLQTLVRLNSDLGITIVLVEHRLERVLPFVDHMIYLAPDTSVVSGTPDSVLSQMELMPPLIQLAKALHWNPLPLTIKAGLRFSLPITPPPREDVAQPPVFTAPPMIHVRGVGVSYRTRQVLQNVSFSVARGEIVVMLGRNGAGKTTLLKALVGLVRPDRGQILIDGKDIAALDTATICRRVGYVPQDPNALLFADTVLDELRTTLRNHGMPETPYINELIARLQLSTKGEDYPRDLSVGERQRVALGAILVTQPTVLLLDEPTRGLDYDAKHALCSLLQQYRADGTAIVIVTHDVEFAAELADRVVVLGRGEVIAQGSFAAIAATSPLFAPQTARLFPHTGWMTPTDALRGLGNSEL